MNRGRLRRHSQALQRRTMMDASRRPLTRTARAWLGALLAGSLLIACGGGGDDGNTGNGGSYYTMTALVSDGNTTPHTDTHLVNGWGVAFNPNGYVWVADAETSTSTLYDGNGVPQSLVVSIPDGAAGPANPTGIVYNGSGDFVVSQGGLSGAAPFIFVGEAGTLSGWAPGVDLHAAVTVYDGSAGGTSYKGLALAQQAGASFLYATDFHNGHVDVFDRSFTKVSAAGGFSDPALPAGYAPFGIQAIGGKVYVAFAKQDASAGDEVTGAGLGIVDVFDTSGTLLQRLVTGGPLNAPWGIAMAPANFGPFSNALLVGNFGDGRINAFNPSTGAHLGTLSDANGAPIVIDGLWGIAFGNGINSQPANTLFFAAGPNDETHGLYGRIDVH
jgi:uncharacterized protein (TIGR03118 family)